MADYPCGVCMKEVGNEDEGILCELRCQRWFHRECTGLTKVAFDLLQSAPENVVWACDRCKPPSSSN